MGALMVRYTRLKERGVCMEQKVAQAYLYDFYGELLNKRQQKIYEDFIFHDLSLSEIAQEEGISRQGVHDMVRRCTSILEGYEAKLHLVQKFLDTKERVSKIHALTKEFRIDQEAAKSEQILSQINELSNAILEEL